MASIPLNFSALNLIFASCMLFGISGHAQSVPEDRTLFFHLNTEQNTWMAAHAYGQFWARHLDNNPGSIVGDELANTTTDFSIRRFRLGFQGVLAPRLFAYAQLGLNNLNYQSPRGTSVDLLDAYAEFRLSPKFTIGGGKTAWTGLSRYAAPNTSKLLSFDLLPLALPTDDETDDLIRKLSVFAKGKWAPFDYRFVVSKPFSAANSSVVPPPQKDGIARFVSNPKAFVYSGYLKLELWEAETNNVPFSNGTYLGQKKVLSIGIGAEYEKDALASSLAGSVNSHDMRLFALDAFLDLPLRASGNTALTAYAAFYNYDFGPNYLRFFDSNNPVVDTALTQTAFNGPGNSYPSIGTGRALFLQMGYLLPKMGAAGKYGQLQPYFSAQHADFDRLGDVMRCHDFGINWLLKGHLSKFTLNIRQRPLFSTTDAAVLFKENKYSVILQYILRLE